MFLYYFNLKPRRRRRSLQKAFIWCVDLIPSTALYTYCTGQQLAIQQVHFATYNLQSGLMFTVALQQYLNE